MGLCIEFRQDGMAPVILCDWCGERIADAADGNYAWGEGNNGDQIPVWFTHKRCHHAWAAKYPDRDLFAEELRVLPLFLHRNLNIDSKRLKEYLKLVAELR